MASDGARAVVFLGIIALVVRFGEDVPIATLAGPIIVVAAVILVLLLAAEVRAYRRWSLH